MAKPKHGRWNNYARPSSSTTSSATRRFTRTRSPNAVPRPFPSPALLSALAVIATTPTVVAGNPLPLPLTTPPPSFLCPFIELDNIDPSSFLASPSCTPVPSSSAPFPSPTLPSRYVQRQVVADRYVEGSDSLWRKTDAWTLYGSTCCSTSTTPIPSDIQSQPASSQTPMPSSANSSVTETFDTSALPAGWDSATTTSNTESTIIFSLAIVLAGCICVFMIGCLVWRRRKKKTRDIERKLGRNHNVDNDAQENAQEKDPRGKMRMWAKASARWRSNVRQSARRRRKRPLGSSISSRPLSPSFCDSQASVVPPSRRGSIAPEEPNPSEPEPVSSFGDSLPRPSDVQHGSPRPVSPPTYGASLSPPLFLHSPPSSAVSHPSPTPPDRLAQHSSRSSFIVDEPLPYIPRNDGHVAIDDKAQLARMQQLASSPPIALNAASASTTQPISVPDWHEVEDDLENYGVDPSESFVDFGLPPSFPPPPSKTDVPFGYLDGDHLCFGERDDIPIPLSIPELSASPSGRSTSAPPPPIDYPGLEPSAPSLECEDVIFQDWDGASYVPEAVAPADRDSTLSGVMESPIPPSVSSILCAPSSTRGPDATDSILPQYHP